MDSPKSAGGRLESYVEELEAHGIRLIPKSQSSLNRWIDRVLRLLTCGGQDRYMSDYVTTLGKRIYLPSSWDRIPPDEQYCILRHERVHVRQFRRLTWPGMVLLYVFLPLPMVFAAGRAYLEWQGYKETLTATWEVYGPDRACDGALRREIIGRFTGPDYAWMWIWSRTIDRAIDRHLARLNGVRGSNGKKRAKK
jgi:hypothetical protein